MIRNLFIATLLALGAVSCSDIKESDRFITIEGVTAERVVLLEDFTGQNCVNCPAAHQEIDALVKQYGDALVRCHTCRQFRDTEHEPSSGVDAA